MVESVKRNSWTEVATSSTLFLMVKFIFGTASNVLLYSLFSAQTIVIISQIGLMQKLPVIFSFGIKSKVHDVVITGGSETDAFSNLITVKVFSYLMALGVIFGVNIFVGSFLFDFQIFILSIFLVLITVSNDILYSLSFTRGKLSFLINLMTAKTFVLPIIFYFFAEKYQINAWLLGMIFFELLQFIILLNYLMKVKSFFSLETIGIRKIFDFFRKTFIYHLNTKINLIFELFLFFYFVATLDIYQASLLSWLVRMSHTLTNIIGATIQKKFLFELINLVGKEELGVTEKIQIKTLIQIYDAAVFIILFPVTIFYIILTVVFIEKFSDYWEYLFLILALTFVRLKGLIFLRMLLTRDLQNWIRMVFAGSAAIFFIGATLTMWFSKSAIETFAIFCSIFFARTILNFMALSFSISTPLAIGSFLGTLFYASSIVLCVYSFLNAEISNSSNFGFFFALAVITAFYMLYLFLPIRSNIWMFVRRLAFKK